ncbi:hypothetical protein CVT24_003118 [Panaeolus cyanescens]|uniref:Cytochrome P450 n=1 Tax=Panaeolus cyanescens TaxID=181874 RepID=A0A409W1R5_9AGAR|nr:hypothetical protein CVT24_003118 [Panaeolus cyanescens]
MIDNVSLLEYAPTTLLLVGGVALLARYINGGRKYGPLPPGPKPYPIIGNALDIPFKRPGQAYLELSKKLGSDIVHLYALGNRIIVLNSREALDELLEKRAAIYSDRPDFPTIDMLGWDYNVAALRYGDPWRQRRRICQQNFKAQTAHRYHPIQIRKVHDMLVGLVDTPERFEDHNKMLSISIPLTTMYGYEVKSLDDPVIVAADRGIELGIKVFSPGGSLVNLFPPLKHVPWTWTQRMAKEVRHHSSEMKRIPMEALSKDMENGTAIPSLMADFLEKKQTVGATAAEEKVLLDIANTVYAGIIPPNNLKLVITHTNRLHYSTKTLIYQLMMHPEIQVKAQAEIDRVLGSPARLPTFEDRPSLPYIEAMYREVLRWCPPLPIGAPHCNIEDDWYNGYFIPKGTAVFANIWAINRDEKHYGPDAYEFNPDRFLDANGNLNDNDRILAYGFGRRVCVGKHVASSTVRPFTLPGRYLYIKLQQMWLIIASVVACFTLRKPKDEHGNEIEINHEFDEDGILSRRKHGPLPPGPKPYPIIGNALDIPFKSPGQAYLELSQKIGSSIIYLSALGNRILVLNSREDIDELLERRAAIYSDRPDFPTIDMIGWDYNIATLRYGDPWRYRRRICQQNFKSQTAHKYHPIQIRKVYDMLVGLLDTPERFDDHNKMLSISIPLTTMYGYEVRTLDDPVITAADRSVELGAKLISPGGSLVNLFPPLKYVPWTWTQRIAKEAKHFSNEMRRIPVENLKKEMKLGTAIPSLIGKFLEHKQTIGATAEEENAMLDIANTVYAAAADTTISATRTLFYQLMMHPEIQVKAQVELDHILGSPARLPTFEDRPSLPYIEAIYREVLRWCPPLTIGSPHCTTEDDWYKGYFIPKGTTVFANIWGVNRDEKRYGADAYEFNPDRFFDENGNLNDDNRILAYGFGRRVCVGKHIASGTMWLTIASVLACFNLKKPKDKDDNEIEINHEFDEDGLLAVPVPPPQTPSTMSKSTLWPASTISILLGIGGLSLLARYSLQKKDRHLPPGPKPRFIIGNALDIPYKQPGQKYLEYSKELGSKLFIRFLMITITQYALVLNSREDVEELFERRAAIYSDRPEFATVDLLGWDYNVAILRYGDLWRRCRRICQQLFKVQTAHQFHPVQVRKVHDMLVGLLDDPDRASISISLTTMYGYEVKSLDDPVIVAADQSIELGMKVFSPGGSLVNLFPPFKYVPWTWTQRMAKQVRYLTNEMKRIPMEALAHDMARGEAIPSMMGDFLEKKQTSGVPVAPEEEKLMLNIANTVYAGASDTTISATKTLFYQLVMHPEVQAKAQAEIDRVLGSPARLPMLEDRPSLPYIEAIYREVLRWCPPLPNGVAHCNTQDDWYKGYLIPKGES